MEEWGLGGGIVSTAAPAAAAVRLLARGAIDARGALPPERCVEPDDLFPELERRNCTFDIGGERHPMKVGVPTEIKTDEYRVSLTPGRRARAGRARPRGADPERRRRRARRSTTPTTRRRARASLPDAETVFGEAEMVLGVKEPQPQEVAMLRPDHMLFTYLHLAPDPELTRGWCESGATCIAYETVEDARAGCRCSRR